YQDSNVNGQLRFEEGQAYLEGVNYQTVITTINNVEMRIVANDQIPIYFDEEVRQGNYIAIGEDVFRFNVVEGDFRSFGLHFQRDNPYLGIEEENSFSIVQSDPDQLFDIRLRIANDNPDLVPRIHLGGTNVRIANGGHGFTLEHDELYYEHLERRRGNSIPAAVYFEDDSGNNILDQYIVFDQQGNFASIPTSESQYMEAQHSANLLGGIENEDGTTFVEFIEARFEREGFEHISIVGGTPERTEPITDLGLRSLVLAQLENLPPEIRADLTEIQLLRREVFTDTCQGGDACAAPEGYPGRVFLSRSGGFTFSDIYHEAAHVHEKTLGVPFEREWTQLHEAYGEVYGRGLVIEENRLSFWNDGEREGPRHGCVRPYGCTNFREDVATYLEPIARRDYEFFRDLVTPGSEQYDSSYLEKLILLERYGFITENDLEQIQGLRG
ncbi:MAG TPA: hypothetical protein VJG49_04575, partial [Candidatus Nanoarchaeia archaeon]|nr:hypothetical protein [Candidatus Nanoarchaeia archaeon]